MNNCLENYPKAIADYDMLLALDPDYYCAIFMKAFTLFLLNKIKQAMECLKSYQLKGIIIIK